MTTCTGSASCRACTNCSRFIHCKGGGTCTNTYKGGDKISLTWEEGSHLKEYSYKNTGGTGKYEGASGGGTYTLEELTDTLLGGKYKGKIELP